MPSDSSATASTALPSPALVIASTVERADRLRRAFPGVRAATLDHYLSVLADVGAQLPCVAVTGVPAGGGRLAEVVRDVIAHCPPTVQLIIEASGPEAADLLSHADTLRGLELVESVRLDDGHCLRMAPSPDPDRVLDLMQVARVLSGSANPTDNSGDTAESLRAARGAARLRARVEELEAQVAASAAELANVTAAHRLAVEQAERLRRNPVVAAWLAARTAYGGLDALPPHMRRLVTVAGAGAGAALVVAAVATEVADRTDTGFEGAAITALLLTSPAPLLYARRTTRRSAEANNRVLRAVRGVRQEMRKLAARQVASDEHTRVELSARLDNLCGGLAELRGSLTALSTVATGTAARVTAIGETVSRIPAAHKSASMADIRLAQAIASLYSGLAVKDLVPLPSRWAAPPDLILLLVEQLRARRPSLLVECGSGISTLWLALAVRRFGLDTRIVALEHDPEYAARTREWLSRHDVEGAAEVRVAPLRPAGLPGHETLWYDAAAIADLRDVGMIFVDGPPSGTGPRARYPVVPLLASRLSAEAMIVLDDAARPDEIDCVTAWEPLLPGFTIERPWLERAAVILRRG